MLPYLVSGARAIGKDPLRAGVRIKDNASNKTPLKELVNNHLLKSRDFNFKRQAKEKTIQLMRGSGYISSAKRRPGQFVPDELDAHFAEFEKSRRKVAKKSITSRKRSTKMTKKKKRVIKKLTNRKKKKSKSVRKTSKQTVSNIFA